MGGDVEMPTPPWRKPRRSAPVRRPLGQDLIVDTAIRVLEAEGLDAVSMRRVAQELGTGPASLYAHVSGKDELLELMLDRVFAGVELPEPDPARWQEQIKEVARTGRRVLRAHADIARVSLASIPTGPNLLRIAEHQLALLRAGGVPSRIAALAVDNLGKFIDADVIEGAAFFNKVRPGGDPHEHMEKVVAGIRDYYASLPADRFPTIVSMVDDLVEGGDDERFEFGLDLLVRGIASYAVGPEAQAG